MVSHFTLKYLTSLKNNWPGGQTLQLILMTLLWQRRKVSYHCHLTVDFSILAEVDLTGSHGSNLIYSVLGRSDQDPGFAIDLGKVWKTKGLLWLEMISGIELISIALHYKHIMIINDDSNVVNKFEASLTDDASRHLRSSYVYRTDHRSYNFNFQT
jgi:hypothetical protein